MWSAQRAESGTCNLNCMRALYLTLSALLCVVAIVGRVWTGGPWLSLVAMVAAAIFLTLGLRGRAQKAPVDVASLAEWQREELKVLLAQGQFGTAVKQVRLWFRDASEDDAAAIVQQLT